jgi:transcriptional regulator with XRE-family HTH domain
VKTAAEVAKEKAEGRAKTPSPPMNGNVKLGELARKLRERHGLTQANVADAVGLTRWQITNIETGRSLPSLPTLIKLASFYECNLDYLAGHMVERKKPMRGSA